jgi:hypothetical protein
MRTLRAGPVALMALALTAVLGLMVLSEFQPARLPGLDDLDSNSPGEVAVIVVRCRPCSGGFLLNITDGEGHWADAYCSQDVRSSPLVNGTSVRAVLQRSAEDPSFLYVKELSIVAEPTTKD